MICAISSVVLHPILLVCILIFFYVHVFMLFSQIIPANCAAILLSLTPRCLPSNFQQKKKNMRFFFTVPAPLVLLKLVACMHTQMHTNTHKGALKWKRPQALYLPFIIHPPQHKQHRADIYCKNIFLKKGNKR